MQVYKELRILSARPLKKNYNKIKHHLYGFHSVKKKFSVGHWLKLTNKNIKNILDRKKIPIVVGGTGLYFKTLTDGLVRIPQIPDKVRKEIINYQNKIGQKIFYKELLKLDPKCKNRIGPQDIQRSIRAFEVKKYSGISLFDWFKKTKSNYENHQFIKIYIDIPREEILKKIKARCQKIIGNRSIKEVINFNKLKIKKSLSSNKIIGIFETNEYLAKKYGLIELREKISIKTRQYAKRQATWARGHMSDWTRLSEIETKNYIKKFKY